MSKTALDSGLKLALMGALLLLTCTLPALAQSTDRYQRTLRHAAPSHSPSKLKNAALRAVREADRYGIQREFVIAALASEADLEEFSDETSYLRREFRVQAARNSEEMMRERPVLESPESIRLAINALYYALLEARDRGEKINTALRLYWQGVSGEARGSTAEFIRKTERRYQSLLDAPESSGEGQYTRKTDFSMPVSPGGSLPEREQNFTSAYAESLSPQDREGEYARLARRYNSDLNLQESRTIARAIIQYSREVDLDPRLVTSLIIQESGFQPEVVSSAGAMGIAQLMPATVRSFGISDPYDPVQGVWVATRYLRRELNRFNSSTRLSLAAYNAGAGAVQRYDGIPPYPETQNYVKSVMNLYRRLAG